MNDRPRINRKVEKAYGLGFGKWKMTLDCGHEYVCAYECTQPGKVTACRKCEEQAAKAASTYEAFVKAYIAAALWSTNGGDDEPLDANYTPADLAPDCLKQMQADCEKFWTANVNDLREDVERAGHDFWLTCNGHGAGFWDGDWDEEVAERLTAACKTFGETWLYIGDDGLIYC